MSSLPKGTVNIAAGLALVSFGTLMLGVPLMLMDLANFEKEMSQKRQIVEDMGSQMWSTIMEQNLLTRKARAAELTARQRRQYENSNIKSSPPKNQCPSGSKGVRGEPGEPGMDGEPGTAGAPGSSQVASDPGNAYGEAVTPGCGKCPAGPTGLPGYKGKRGPRGDKGAKGSPGAPGRDGQPGDEGPEGEIGLPGDIGDAGVKGTPGEDGVGYAKGDPGPKGSAGPLGEAGDEDPTGDRGDDAAPGPQGPIGPPGARGDKGKDGINGSPGTQGLPGADAEYCPCPERSKGVDVGPAPPAAPSPSPPYQPPETHPANNYGAAVPNKSASEAPKKPEVGAYEAKSEGGSGYGGGTVKAASEMNSESIAEQSTSSRRLSAYNKLVHAALRRRHLR
uniref:Uncharacterized protein n=1 Tax=Meloidogyne enterolobii TaxID=390850 RepID=A0A6V7XV30_MELEN|nr:unnamed protein product [Meloidogyne enterolobii]